MNCPSCKNKSFEKDGRNIVCSACGYSLKKKELEQYRKEKQREVWRIKKVRKRKYLPGVSINEIAIIKNCSRQCVYSHRKKFDKIPGLKPMRFKFNKKIFEWIPGSG